MKIKNKILIVVIVIGLVLSAINLTFQLISELNFKGYLFERFIYWITLIAIFACALRKPLKKYKALFFAFFSTFLLIQCSHIFSTGKLSTSKEIKLNDNYTIKSGASLFTFEPANSIYENKGIWEKEITQWYGYLGNKKNEFTSLNKVDSLKLLSENDSVFSIRFYLNNGFVDQEIKIKTVYNNACN